MPQRDKGEDDEHIQDGTCGALATAPNGDVDVSYDPSVETPVPAAPERERAVVVGHATHHILGRVDPVREGPQSEESPWQEQLQPDDVQVEVPEHAQLEGCVEGPVRVRLRDGNGVDVVEGHFHSQETE